MTEETRHEIPPHARPQSCRSCATMIFFVRPADQWVPVNHDGSLHAPTCGIRRARPGATHVCPWPGCNEIVKRSLWGCPSHWFKVPILLRDSLWRAHRNRFNDEGSSHRGVLMEIDEWVRKQDAD